MPERREDIDVRASGFSAVATTGRKWSKSAEEAAKWAATHIGIPYTRRRTESIDEVRKRTGATFLIVAKKGILYLVTPTGELFFHPNMAHVRIKNLRQGKKDRFIEAAGASTARESAFWLCGKGRSYGRGHGTCTWYVGS